MIGAEATLQLQVWSHASKMALRHRWNEIGLGDTITDGYHLIGIAPHHLAELEGLKAYWSGALGIKGARLLTGSEMEKTISSPIANCALYDPTAFTIAPTAITEGLRRLCAHPTIQLSERTHVRHVIASANGRWDIHTSGARINASEVAICTGAFPVNFLHEIDLSVRLCSHPVLTLT